MQDLYRSRQLVCRLNVQCFWSATGVTNCYCVAIRIPETKLKMLLYFFILTTCTVIKHSQTNASIFFRDYQTSLNVQTAAHTQIGIRQATTRSSRHILAPIIWLHSSTGKSMKWRNIRVSERLKKNRPQCLNRTDLIVFFKYIFNIISLNMCLF